MKRLPLFIAILATLPAGIFAGDICTSGRRLWPERAAAWQMI
ncbi:MAG: hypothetical protein ABSF34_01895 [Verrucomicrobiota bacterium]